MTETLVRATRDVTAGARHAGRAAAQSPTRVAARAVMSKAGHAVLGAVVDVAVSRVDRVADRLDGVAESGGSGLREALTGRPARTRPDRRPLREAGTAVRARVGAAFGLVIARAVILLRFLQRIARQLLEALRRLARRPRTAAAEPDAAGSGGEGAAQDGAGQDSAPDARRESGEERRPRPAPQDDPRPERPAGRRRRPAPPPKRARQR